MLKCNGCTLKKVFDCDTFQNVRLFDQVPPNSTNSQIEVISYCSSEADKASIGYRCTLQKDGTIAQHD